MYYHPLIIRALAAEHQAELQRQLHHLQFRGDVENPRQHRRRGRRHPSES